MQVNECTNLLVGDSMYSA